jgi:hypothetical protein
MYNFLTIGYDCSPAMALRTLQLRNFALPFDWVVSNIQCIEKCFSDNFEKYHTNLRIINGKGLIDDYGFIFPHDYPLDNHVEISGDWTTQYNTVKEKYNRRIERFNHIMNDSKPIIVLCRYTTKGVLQLQYLFRKYYNKTNVFFLNSSSEKFENNYVKNIDTEKNGIWNDTKIWKENIDLLLQNIPITKPKIKMGLVL